MKLFLPVLLFAATTLIATNSLAAEKKVLSTSEITNLTGFLGEGNSLTVSPSLPGPAIILAVTYSTEKIPEKVIFEGNPP